MSRAIISNGDAATWAGKSLVDNTVTESGDAIVLNNSLASGVTIAGLEDDQQIGDIRRVYNRGTQPITFAAEDSAAAAKDRFNGRMAIPAGGMAFIRYNGTRWEVYSPTTDRAVTWEIMDDLLGNAGEASITNKLAAAGGGTGQGWALAQTAEYPYEASGLGVLKANHGTGTTSRLDLVFQSQAGFAVELGLFDVEYESRFVIVNLSNGTNRYETFDGFFDFNTVDPAFNYGVLLRYTDNVNGGRWYAVCRSAAGPVETVVDTGVTPVAGQWYNVKVRVNAAANLAQFYINGVLVATITTNILTGAANRYTAESNNDRSLGSTNFISRLYDFIRVRRLGSPSRTHNV